MELSCVRQTLIPGTSKLFADFLYSYDKVSAYYPLHFSDEGALVRAAGQVRFPESRRSQIVEALRTQNGDSAALAKLAQPGTVAVVTGQQVGLFSGPAYTVFKALTAAALAAELTAQGVPAVPIFWLATEDHDVDEVSHAWVFDQDATPRELHVKPTGSIGGPVGDLKLADVPLTELRTALGELPFADEVLQKVAAAYHSGNTLGEAFRQLIQDLLAGFDLLFLDPLRPEIREICAPFLSDVAGRAADVTASLRTRSQDLEAAGYHAQVHIENDASLLFLLSEDRRIPLKWKDGRFVTKERSYTPAEVQSMGRQLSPNALLRPVMQDYLLPTVSYVGGPAEIAYLAQSEVLYDKLLGRMPVIFPRKSFTLLDGRATKLIGKYGITLTDLLDYQELVKSRLASKLVPDHLAEGFVSLRSNASSALARLESSLSEFDPTLSAAAHKSGAKILYQIEKLSQKTARETMRRDRYAEKDAAYLSNLVYPKRHLQERMYSIIPFLAKHGLDLPQRLYAEMQLACPDHMVRSF